LVDQQQQSVHDNGNSVNPGIRGVEDVLRRRLRILGTDLMKYQSIDSAGDAIRLAQGSATPDDQSRALIKCQRERSRPDRVDADVPPRRRPAGNIRMCVAASTQGKSPQIRRRAAEQPWRRPLASVRINARLVQDKAISLGLSNRERGRGTSAATEASLPT
jgi:hypothetical protein